MIFVIVDIFIPTAGILLGIFLGGRPEKIAATITMAAFASSALISNQTWDSVEWSILTIDSIVLLIFWSISITSNKFWPYWVTELQLITVLVHLQMIISEPLSWAYGMMSIYLSIPIVIIIGVSSLMHRGRSA